MPKKKKRKIDAAVTAWSRGLECWNKRGAIHFLLIDLLKVTRSAESGFELTLLERGLTFLAFGWIPLLFNILLYKLFLLFGLRGWLVALDFFFFLRSGPLFRFLCRWSRYYGLLFICVAVILDCFFVALVFEEAYASVCGARRLVCCASHICCLACICVGGGCILNLAGSTRLCVLWFLGHCI